MSFALLLVTFVKAGIGAYSSFDTKGFGEKELEALQDALSAGDGISRLWKRGGNVRAGAKHLALVTQAFGMALGRYWGNSPYLSPQRGAVSRAWDRLLGDTQRSEHEERIKQRLEIAAVALAALQDIPSDVAAGTDELRVLQNLSASPLNFPYYRALLGAFLCAQLPGESEPWELAIEDTREFERYFRHVYTEALATPVGAEVQRWLLDQAEQTSEALRYILAEDMAAWGRRHVFGNVRAKEPSDPLPFLSLDDSYVEPYGRIAEGHDKLPLLKLIHAQLESSRIVVVKADFGHGKSLTARRLARNLADTWLSNGKPSPELHFPVFIKCSRDMRDARYEHDEVVRQALWNQAKEALEQTHARKELMFAPMPADQAALYLFDGLDEVALSAQRLEDFFKDVDASLGPRQRAVIFTRPGVLPARLPGVRVIELLPFIEDSQVEQWIERWNRVSNKPPVSMGKLVELGLRELASTPILLLMIALTWADHHESIEALDQVQLYEDFFRHIAKGKYGEPGKHGDPDEHIRIRAAADKLAKQLRKQRILPEEEPISAMLWLMSRVAWEAHCYAYSHPYGLRLGAIGEPKPLLARHVEQLIEKELELHDSDTLEAVKIGLLLAMQIDPTGGSPTILFGHQSFREFLVARYWAHQLVALVQMKRREHGNIEGRLMQERLLQKEDRAFDMLRSMLHRMDEETRKGIRNWAQECVEDDSLSTDNLRQDRRTILRESALAIGSAAMDTGLELNEWTLRSIWIWFEFHRRQLQVWAPRLQSLKAMLQGANLQGANLQGANLQESNLQGANLQGANLDEANLRRANLRRANLAGANLAEAKLAGTSLERASLAGTLLAGASLERASLERANLQGANLQGAKLQGANLQGANLVRASLVGANLVRSSLVGANLVEAKLQGAELQGAKLQGAKLQGAELQGAKYDRETEWPEGFEPLPRGE